jgi:hypothetical protein
MSLYYRAFVCLLWETAVGLILLLIHRQTPSSTLNSHSTICQIRKMLPTNCYTLPAWASMAAYICSITMNRSCESPIIVRLLFLCAVACIAMYGRCVGLRQWFHMPGNVTNLYFYCCDGQGTYYAFGIKGPFDSVEPSSPTYGAYRLP